MRTFLLLFLISIPAHASIFLEPEVGYEIGKYTETVTSPSVATTNISNNVNGVSYGGKLGYRKRMFFLGGEYQSSSLTGDLTSKDISIFAGLSFLHFRIWGNYIINAKINDGNGSGYKVGLGTRLFYMLRLNAEYAVRNYNTYNGPALPTGSGYVAALKSFIVSISLPLNF